MNLWLIMTPNFFTYAIGLTYLIKMEKAFLAVMTILSPSFFRSKSALTPLPRKHIAKVNSTYELRCIKASVRNFDLLFSIR